MSGAVALVAFALTCGVVEFLRAWRRSRRRY